MEISSVESCTSQMEEAKTQEGWSFHQAFLVASSFDPIECYNWLQLVDREIPTTGGIKYILQNKIYFKICCTQLFNLMAIFKENSFQGFLCSAPLRITEALLLGSAATQL